MIIELFLVLFVLAAFLIGLGYYTGDAFHAFVGFFFIFILGIMILGNQLEYKTGYSEYYVYGDNYTGYHWDYDSTPPTCTPNDLDCVKLFHTIREYDYAAFTGSWARWIGFLLAFAAGAAMALQLFYWRYDDG